MTNHRPTTVDPCDSSANRGRGVAEPSGHPALPKPSRHPGGTTLPGPAGASRSAHKKTDLGRIRCRMRSAFDEDGPVVFKHRESFFDSSHVPLHVGPFDTFQLVGHIFRPRVEITRPEASHNIPPFGRRPSCGEDGHPAVLRMSASLPYSDIHPVASKQPVYYATAGPIRASRIFRLVGVPLR